MKLPNGFGSVYKLTGKRRKPYIARKTVSWELDEATGKVTQKYITIGCYETKKEAMAALVDYNNNPYDINTNKITFEEVYEKWSDEHFEKISAGAIRTYKSAYSYCSPLYRLKMKEIRVYHLEAAIKNAKVGDATKLRMKSLFNNMYRYALKNEIVDKNYAEFVEVTKKETDKKKIHAPLTDKEIKTIYDNIDIPFAKMVLIGIYSGWRPQELAILKVDDVDLENRTFTGGIKTEAGTNRIVPIHPAIYEYVKEYYDHAKAVNSPFLFNDAFAASGSYTMTYDKYRGRFRKVMDACHLKHRPHDLRHTFITKAKEYNVDEYCLKLIVGHAIQDITEKVYTKRTIDQLRQEIEKIPKIE